MTRFKPRGRLKTTGLIVVGFLALYPLLAKGAGTKPNVLFIAVDDLRPQLGCYGQDQIKSPALEHTETAVEKSRFLEVRSGR